MLQRRVNFSTEESNRRQFHSLGHETTKLQIYLEFLNLNAQTFTIRNLYEIFKIMEVPWLIKVLNSVGFAQGVPRLLVYFLGMHIPHIVKVKSRQNDLCF